MQKLRDLLQSRRFWLSVSGVVFVATDHFGIPLSEDQAQTIVLMLVAWIIGDSLRSTASRPRRSTSRRVLLLAGIVPSLAATPLVAQEIDTPSQAEPYRLVRSEAKCDQPGGYAWIIRRLPDGFRPDVVRVENGKVAIWTGPPGVYEIDLICQLDGTLTQARARVTIREEEPEPDPQPGPGPSPDPDPAPDPEVVPTDEFNNLGRKVLAMLRDNANADFPAAELSELYYTTAQRLQGKRTPIIPTVSVASEILVEEQEAMLQGADADVWLTVRKKIQAAWKEHERSMDRSKAARFISAVGNGLAGFAK